MPTACQELRDEFGVDDQPVIAFLESQGYRWTRDGRYEWIAPNREPTRKELRAMTFLVQEWDWGWLRTEKGAVSSDRSAPDSGNEA